MRQNSALQVTLISGCFFDPRLRLLLCIKLNKVGNMRSDVLSAIFLLCGIIAWSFCLPESLYSQKVWNESGKTRSYTYLFTKSICIRSWHSTKTVLLIMEIRIIRTILNLVRLTKTIHLKIIMTAINLKKKTAQQDANSQTSGYWSATLNPRSWTAISKAALQFVVR